MKEQHGIHFWRILCSLFCWPHSKRQVPNAENGYVALLAVLIVSAVAVAVAFVLLVGGADTQKGSLIQQESVLARDMSDLCAEEALQRLYQNTSFTGTNIVTEGSNTCSYTVTNPGGTTRVINTSATINGVVRKLQIYATIGASSISITSWLEVS